MENIKLTHEEQQRLLSLADTMAAAATNFNHHNYDLFVNARDGLVSALREPFIVDKYYTSVDGGML